MTRDKLNQKEIDRERARLAGLFAGSDETKREVLDGLIDEAAKCRCELRYWTNRRDGLLERGAPFSVTVPIDNLIVKLRAGYVNINEKLCKWLTAGDDGGFDEELEEYV